MRAAALCLLLAQLPLNPPARAEVSHVGAALMGGAGPIAEFQSDVQFGFTQKSPWKMSLGGRFSLAPVVSRDDTWGWHGGFGFQTPQWGLEIEHTGFYGGQRGYSDLSAGATVLIRFVPWVALDTQQTISLSREDKEYIKREFLKQVAERLSMAGELRLGVDLHGLHGAGSGLPGNNIGTRIHGRYDHRLGGRWILGVNGAMWVYATTILSDSTASVDSLASHGVRLLTFPQAGDPQWLIRSGAFGPPAFEVGASASYRIDPWSELQLSFNGGGFNWRADGPGLLTLRVAARRGYGANRQIEVKPYFELAREGIDFIGFFGISVRNLWNGDFRYLPEVPAYTP